MDDEFTDRLDPGLIYIVYTVKARSQQPFATTAPQPMARSVDARRSKDDVGRSVDCLWLAMAGGEREEGLT